MNYLKKLSLFCWLFVPAVVMAQTENALNFDNIDDEVVVPAASARIAGSNQITLTCWVKPMNANISFPDYDGFAGIRNNADADFYMVHFGPTRLEARFRNSNGVNFDVIDTAVSVGVWQHYALTYNGAELTLYKNGQFVATTVANGSISNATEALFIGGMPYGTFNYYLSGEVDEVTLWNRYLSPAEIRCLANFGTAPTSSGLQLYYKFNQGIAAGNNTGISSLNDETGNINGAMNNFGLNGPLSNFVTGVATVNDITDFICPGSTYAFGPQTLTAPGVYTQVYLSSSFCDSTVRLTLSSGINDAVDNDGTTLTAQQAGASYQWLDCSNGNQPIPGETGQLFTPTSNGTYAVTVSTGSCTTTSACQSFSTVGISVPVSLEKLKVYPNPVQDFLMIDLQQQSDFTVIVADQAGRVIYLESVNAARELRIATSQWAKGTYVLTVENPDGKAVQLISK